MNFPSLLNKISLLVIFLVVSQIVSGQYPYIGFDTNGWNFTNGVTLDEASGEITLVGSPTEYREASITIDIPETSMLYFSLEAFFENIVPGSKSFHTPKLKIYDSSGQVIKVDNYANPTEGTWNKLFCETDVSGYQQIVLEIGMQNCSGTFKVKLPEINNSQYPNINFFTNNWDYTSGASYDGANGQLHISGQSSSIQAARKNISIPATSTLYFSADFFFENIIPGIKSFHTPRLKIVSESGKNLAVLNISDAIENRWYRIACSANVSNYENVKLEIVMQNCAGTLSVKNPVVSDVPAQLTPYEFPYEVPADPSCFIDINTEELTPFNNDLLSANCHFSWASYDWGDTEVITAINNYFPMTNLRFPGGTVANFYDYETDGFYNDAATFVSKSRENMYNSGFTFNYEGMKAQALNTGASNTLLFNVMFDDVEKNKARLQSRLNDGLDIKWIELGNEHYHTQQAYHNISEGWENVDVQQYIVHTKSVVNGLKQVDPDIKVSVCGDHQSIGSLDWTGALALEDYYDAVTFHNYINLGNAELSLASGISFLTAYKKTRARIEAYKQVFGQTPLIFTEWGISDAPLCFLNTLGRADIFMALLEGSVQDDVVKQAGMHMFYHSDKNQDQTMTYFDGEKMVYTATGAMYSQLFQVFANNQVFNALSHSALLEEGLPGVIAKAVRTPDEIKVFIVNKLPVVSPLQLSFDGHAFNGTHEIASFHHNVLSGWPAAYDSPLDAWVTSSDAGIPQIPAYSITVVTIKHEDLPTNTSASKPVIPDILPYPNPTSVMVYLGKTGEYVVFNSSGKLMHSGYGGEVDFSALSKGVYFLQIDKQHYKIVKQ